MVDPKTTRIDLEQIDEAGLRELVPMLLEKIALQDQRIAELVRMVHGRSSEKSRYMHPGTLLPFAEFDELREDLEAAKKAAKTVEVPAHTRTANKRRKDFPDHLPRRTTTCAVDADQLPCPDCGEVRVQFGVETRQELERIEITYVHVFERAKHACRSCQGNVIVADGPPCVIEKSILGPGFLAQIIFERFCNHMPYARLEKKYKAEGLSLSRSVMCSSVLRCAELLEPVYDAHVADVLESLENSVLQSDDTTVVQRNGNQPGCRDVHVWAWRDQYAGVFYEATDTRNRDGPKAVIGNRRGRLQCDGHDCYSGLDPGEITRIGCWAHVRRYFEKAKRSGDANANEMLDWIGTLFRVEREAKQRAQDERRTLTDEELLALRREKSKSILDAIRAWLDHAQLNPPSLPGGPLMKGVVYTRNQWATLIRFLDDGRIREISNNGCERALRATVIGRKNWQFFGSEEGAKAAAVMMSLAQSCREHGINPLLYLRDVLHRISTTPQSRIRELTPRGWKAVGDEIERHKQGQDAIAAAVRSLSFRLHETGA